VLTGAKQALLITNIIPSCTWKTFQYWRIVAQHSGILVMFFSHIIALYLLFLPRLSVAADVTYVITFNSRFVPDRVIRSQLARPTRLPGFNSSVKICIAVYIILVLSVLVLLVMHILVDLQVLQIWDFVSTLKSRQAKLSHASSMGSPPGRPQSTQLRKDVEPVLRAVLSRSR
jgi:hypothetical protein